MAYISKVQLPNGSEYDVKDNRLPEAATADEGKTLVVNDQGEWEAAVEYAAKIKRWGEDD